MTNICFFSGDITRNGGTERVAVTICNSLSNIGKYKISFLSLVEQKTESFYPILPQIKRYVLKDDRKWIPPGSAYLTYIPALRRFLKEQEIDIIIDIDIVLDVLTLSAAVGLPVKIISWEHFNYFFERSIGYRKVIQRLSVKYADYIVTLTERDRQCYQAMTNRKERIVAIDNPLEIPEVIDVAREKILVTVGQLIYRKGIDLLIKIVPVILKKYRDWKWYFLGDGEYMDRLRAVRAYYRLEEQLILPGVVTEIDSYLRRASILVMGSREEGLPMCLLEARAYRVPCIAFDIPVGPLELIAHGMTGFLITPFDLDDMVEKISRLIEDDALRERFMCNAAAGMEKFQLGTVLKKWVWLLDTVSCR